MNLARKPLSALRLRKVISGSREPRSALACCRMASAPFLFSSWLASGLLVVNLVGCGQSGSVSDQETEHPPQSTPVSEIPKFAEKGTAPETGLKHDEQSSPHFEARHEEGPKPGEIENRMVAADAGDPFADSSETKTASRPEANVRPATQSELGPEIHTASMKLERKIPNPGSPKAVSGSPEWDLEQIANLMAESKSMIQDSEISETTRFNRIEDNNRRIVSLASHAISETHQSPEQEKTFNVAVLALMEARLQLALRGNRQAMQELYNDAAMLGEQRPGSVAAMTAAGTVLRLAESLARRDKANSPWLSELVRQSKLFASNFPEEEARATIQLMKVAELCETRHEQLAAIECYSMIEQVYPDSPFLGEIERSLRRMNLVDSSVQLAGRDQNGEMVRLRELKGKPVLLVFWSSKSNEFANHVSALNAIAATKTYSIIGVNLDRKKIDYEEFLSTRELAGRHLFPENEDMRGSMHPLVQDYGIDSLPTYWLIDKQGLVQSTRLSFEELQGLSTSVE